MTSLDQVVEWLEDVPPHKLGLTVVITGASSGIGLDAAKLLAVLNPCHRVVLVARTQDKADAAKAAVLDCVKEARQRRQQRRVRDSDDDDSADSDASSSCTVIPMACDHCSLADVRRFATDLEHRLVATHDPTQRPHPGIDALCLNAAVLQADSSPAVFTRDGLEVTFQTNHVAPFLLANLLTTNNLLHASGRVVWTSSGLHRFAAPRLSFGGLVDPDTGKARKGFEMMDGSAFHFKKSYAASKLCNVAACLELNERLRHRNGSNAVSTCFSPGLMTSSGLFRRQRRRADASVAMVHNAEVLRKEKTVLWGAGSLVYMAIAKETGARGGLYWSDSKSFAGSAARYGKEFSASPVVGAAAEKDRRQMLWYLSCQLAGLPLVDGGFS